MYVFPLQKVLDYRKKAEEEAQQRLAAAHRETELARLELSRAQTAFTRMQADYTHCQAEKLDINQVLLACEYTARLAEKVRVHQEEVSEMEARLSAQVYQTEKAMQDRKVMDILHDKGLSRHRQELKAAEQRQIDEMARTQFLRTQRSE